MDTRTRTDDEIRALVDAHNAGSPSALLEIMRLPPADLARAKEMLEEKSDER